MDIAHDQGLLAVLEARRAEIRRFLIARTGSEADADDILSDLWIKVRSVRAGPIASPPNYLFRMADNLVLDRLRAAGRRQRRETEWTSERLGPVPPSAEIPEPAANAEQLLIEQQQAERLAEAVSHLPARAQSVLRLHKFGGLSHAEVAAELGISKSAVEKHMAVAMAHLRKLMDD